MNIIKLFNKDNFSQSKSDLKENLRNENNEYYEEIVNLSIINIELSIDSYFEVKERNINKTYYRIKVKIIDKREDQKKINYHEWFLDKRYKDFEELNQNFKNNYSKYLLPKFPHKNLFTFQLKSSDKTIKREELDLFLKECLLRDFLIKDKYFCDFLKLTKEINKYQNNDKIEKINIIKKVSSIKSNFFSIFDILTLKSSLVYIIFNNKSISYNDKFPEGIINYKDIEKKDIKSIPCKVTAFRLEQNELKELSSLNIYFNCHITSIYLSSTNLYFGNNKGIIYYINLSEENSNNFESKFKKLNIFKKNKIISIGSTKNDCFYAISKSKLKCYSLITLNEIFQHKFNSSIKKGIYIKDKTGFFINNFIGDIQYMSLLCNICDIKSTIRPFGNSDTLVDFNYDKFSNKLFCISKLGECIIFNVNLCDKDEFIFLIEKKFNINKANPTSICYSQYRSEIFIGDILGDISIYDLYGKSIFVNNDFEMKQNKNSVSNMIINNNSLITAYFNGIISVFEIKCKTVNEFINNKSILVRSNSYIKKEYIPPNFELIRNISPISDSNNEDSNYFKNEKRLLS